MSSKNRKAQTDLIRLRRAYEANRARIDDYEALVAAAWKRHQELAEQLAIAEFRANPEGA